MSELRALLFDVDGTLAETERDGHRAAFNRAFAERQLSWHWSERLYGELLQVTGGRERIAHFAAQHDPQWLRRDDAHEVIGHLHARKNELYQQLLRDGAIGLRRGLRAVLARARAAGLRLAVVTTTSRGNVDSLLEATLDAAGREAFAVRVCGEDVQRKKPDPQCYALALRQLGLEAAQALAVEDSRNGLLAARGAGVAALMVRSFYFEHEDFGGAFGGAFGVIDDFDRFDLDELCRRFRRAESVSPATQSGALPDTVLVH